MILFTIGFVVGLICGICIAKAKNTQIQISTEDNATQTQIIN